MYKVQGFYASLGWCKIVESDNYYDCVDVAKTYSKYRTTLTRVLHQRENGECNLRTMYRGGVSVSLDSEQIATYDNA
jgi:hypothetical protein